MKTAALVNPVFAMLCCISMCSSQALLARNVSRDRLVMKAAVHVWSWYKYWLPRDVVMVGYTPGMAVRVYTAHTARVSGFCCPDLELCMGFNAWRSEELVAPEVWPLKVPARQQDIIAFLERKLAAKSSAAKYISAPSARDEHSFDPERFTFPSLSEAREPDHFDNGEFPYVLPHLKVPERKRPRDLASIKAIVQQYVTDVFPADRCGFGEVIIPSYTPRDPSVYVAADFQNCGRGIVILSFTPQSGWRPIKFVMAGEDVQWFTDRIKHLLAAKVYIR